MHWLCPSTSRFPPPLDDFAAPTLCSRSRKGCVSTIQNGLTWTIRKVIKTQKARDLSRQQQLHNATNNSIGSCTSSSPPSVPSSCTVFWEFCWILNWAESLASSERCRHFWSWTDRWWWLLSTVLSNEMWIEWWRRPYFFSADITVPYFLSLFLLRLSCQNTHLLPTFSITTLL